MNELYERLDRINDKLLDPANGPEQRVALAIMGVAETLASIAITLHKIEERMEAKGD